MLKNEPKIQSTLKAELNLDLLYQDINYGVILSFMDKFGKFFFLKEFIFDEFELSLLDTNETKQNLKDFLWYLIRNTSFGKTAKKEKLNSCLFKYVDKTFGENLKYEKEFCYLDLPSKITVIKSLLDAQFDENPRIKPSLNEQTDGVDGLRSRPIGRDINGYFYWFYVDTEFNLRLFSQYSIDIDGFSWKLIAKDNQQVRDLIDQLVKEPLLEKLQKSVECKPEPFAPNSQELNKPKKSNRQKKTLSDSIEDDDEQISLYEIKKRLDLAHTTIKTECLSNETNSTFSDDIEEESRCTKCSKIKSEYMLIMCDSCDLVYHVDCLKPILEQIPDGDWHCPICEHDKLIKNLQIKIEQIEHDKKEYQKKKLIKLQREEEEKRKQMEIKLEMESKMLSKKFEETIASLENRTGKRACRAKSQINYTFEDYDRQIKEATGGLNNDESENEDKKSHESFKLNSENSEVSDDSGRDEKVDSFSEFELDIKQNYLSSDNSNESEHAIPNNKPKTFKKFKRIQSELKSQDEDETDLEQQNELKLNNRFRKFGIFRKKLKKRIIQDSDDDDYTAYNEDDYFDQNIMDQQQQQQQQEV